MTLQEAIEQYTQAKVIEQRANITLTDLIRAVEYAETAQESARRKADTALEALDNAIYDETHPAPEPSGQ